MPPQKRQNNDRCSEEGFEDRCMESIYQISPAATPLSKLRQVSGLMSRKSGKNNFPCKCIVVITLIKY